MQNKKAQKGVSSAFYLLLFGAVMLVAVAIAGAIGAQVTNNIQTGLTANSYAWAAAGNGTLGIANLAAQLPNVGTVVAAAAIIAILLIVLVGVIAPKRGGRE